MGRVEITQFKPVMVEKMIEFIYQGTYENKTFTQEDPEVSVSTEGKSYHVDLESH